MTSPTAFASIAQAVRAILEAQPPLADRVTLQRVRVLPAQQKTALAVRTDSGSPSRAGLMGAPIDWTTTVPVECYAREDSAEALQERLDQLLAGVYERIQAKPDLGGLAMDTTVGQVRWDFDNGEDHLGCATVYLQVLHRTGSNNLSPQ